MAVRFPLRFTASRTKSASQPQELKRELVFIITVREALPKDAVRISEIYDYYVKHTAVSFEYLSPTPEEILSRMEKTVKKYPYFVALRDGRVEGYCYAGAFVGRAAYDWCCELSIYLDREAVGLGIGRLLYGVMEAALLKMGIVSLFACVGVPSPADEYLTDNSLSFHRHMGFAAVGEFKACGRKFGRWYDTVWMEKRIAPRREDQPPVMPYKRELPWK